MFLLFTTVVSILRILRGVAIILYIRIYHTHSAVHDNTAFVGLPAFLRFRGGKV